MLDSPLRKLLDPGLTRLAALAVEARVSANAATLCGFVCGIGAAGLVAAQLYLFAIPLIVASRLFDGLDGAIARRTAISDLGAFLDIALDFLIQGAIIFGFALARPENALPAAFLLFAFIGTGTTFLSFAIFAQKRRLSKDIRASKSIYYLGGLTEAMETMLALILACIFPDWFIWIAIIFGALCVLTTGTRIATAWQVLSRPNGQA